MPAAVKMFAIIFCFPMSGKCSDNLKVQNSYLLIFSAIRYINFGSVIFSITLVKNVFLFEILRK